MTSLNTNIIFLESAGFTIQLNPNPYELRAIMQKLKFSDDQQADIIAYLKVDDSQLPKNFWTTPADQ